MPRFTQRIRAARFRRGRDFGGLRAANQGCRNTRRRRARPSTVVGGCGVRRSDSGRRLPLHGAAAEDVRGQCDHSAPVRRDHGGAGSQPTSQANAGSLGWLRRLEPGDGRDLQIAGTRLQAPSVPSRRASSRSTGLITLTASATTPRLAVDAATASRRTLVRYVEVDVRRQIDTQISGARQALARTQGRVQRRAVRDTLSSLAAFVRGPDRGPCQRRLDGRRAFRPGLIRGGTRSWRSSWRC